MGDRTGEQLGAYTLVAHVADGSMGSVYEACHREIGERVALKVLHPAVADDAVAVQRFRREYETARALRHAYIVDVHEFGESSDGVHFMTMEFLEGEELSLILEREGALRPAGQAGFKTTKLHKLATPTGNSPCCSRNAASMKPVNNGCPSLGLDVNSGWN